MLRPSLSRSPRRLTQTTAIALAAGLALATVVIGNATPARAGVSADINVHLGDHPAPVVVFDEEPEVVLVPGSRVYYVDHRGYDLYRYGRYWYINDAGFWFRASSYRGQFVGIELRHVPRSITVVPARYRQHPSHPAHPHGGPPGRRMKDRVVVVDDDRGRPEVIVVKEAKQANGKKGKKGD